MKPKSFPSRLFDRNSSGISGERRNSCAAKYQRQVDSVDQPPSDDSSRNEKAKKDLNFTFLPERYEPLIDDDAKAEKKKRKKEKHKKVKKNVGKALRTTWKCLMLGLYNFALAYSTPIAAAATFVPDFHPSRNRT
ncbi:required for drug-induced death protein 1-like isoform X1 [Poeciliopsis prolifica]|uniref:required for drug-induced death protein 1-like isoform X1 n=1 Tax=Poeciliopsis prolifica TaxID=188132 RepID=UPI002413D624|nr:required for drug-induced death protein 1-like isoform X1 [Poeciliopsis prolifica]